MKKLALEFTRILNDWLTPEEIAEINRRDATPEYKDCCATHDFCDPNEAILQAYKTVYGVEPSAINQKQLNTMSNAWKEAKNYEFKQ